MLEGTMRLADFILANVQPIVAEWETFARSLARGAEMTPLALRDAAEKILVATARDMQTEQSLPQQASKSRGHGGAGGAESDRLDESSTTHGLERVGAGFDIMEVVSEYRALRASVLRLWRRSVPQADVNDIDDITRFNEAIDQSLAKAVASFTRRVEQSRRMFLAILSHDLRNPLSVIRMAAGLVARTERDSRSQEATAQIEGNTQVISRLIDDLIDFASTGLGSAMPLSRERVNLKTLCREVFEGFRSTHPQRTLRFNSQGDVVGSWDDARLRQVVSNLVGNALQHGSADGPVELAVASQDADVILSVHNEGTPIPPDALATIFDPLVRYTTPEAAKRRTQGSIGLGLYIVRAIVGAHGGTVSVVSMNEGTTFTVRLPKQPSDQ
ncbi:sensor histidine kinase [Novosphingobium sp.]|uniref:sensor histidine kinase n=1 Tax=Novosphingobium sp. TaxID=1874826 RepID=UPI002FD974A0